MTVIDRDGHLCGINDVQCVAVRRGMTLAEAFAATQVAGAGIGIVLNEDKSVDSVIYDLDLRRELLHGARLEDDIDSILSNAPATLPLCHRSEEAADIMHTYGLPCLPVVNENRLVAVCRLEDCARGTGLMESPIGVVMAGGRGVRLRPLTDKVPKPLLRVGGRTIIERHIAALTRAGVRTVYVAVNYLAGEIERRIGSGERSGLPIQYLRESVPLGTAGALSLLPSDLAGPVVVVNGDIVTATDIRRLLDFHRAHGGSMTVAGVMHKTPIPYGVLHTDGNRLLDVEEKPQHHDLCSAGLYVVHPEVARLVAPGVRTDMPDLIQSLLRARCSVQVFPIVERWFDVGSASDLQRLLLETATEEDD